MSTEWSWKDQWERLERFYKRFEDIDKGRIHNMESSNYEDEVYTFFIFCYHLKDWIKQDKKLNIQKKRVERFIKRNECLRYVAAT